MSVLEQLSPVTPVAIPGDTPMQQLTARLEPLYAELAAHPLYRAIHSIEDLRCFMEHHVFAVWDFMSLLKTLQRSLTGVAVPWLPSPRPESRRLVNEIVLGEESDLYQGRALSHFELYLLAMRQVGASTVAIDRLLSALRANLSVDVALAESTVPAPARAFVQATFSIIASGRLHAVAAAFTFGREDLIPGMFRAFLDEEDRRLAGQLSIYRWYLDRHIEVDSDEHGPMALRMVAELCGDDPQLWQEAGSAAEQAIRARLALWSSITDAIEHRNTT